jgi:uncharacterized membrane protein
MNERQPLSEQQHGWLAEQLAAWSTADIVSADQVEKILSLYESVEQRQDRRRSWLLYTLSALAMVLFGAATMLLVGYNWESLPAAAKLVLIFGAITLTSGTGIYLRYWRNARLASDAFLLLGCLFYGAAIWLVAQIFHMSAHYPDGMFWWAAGVLPLAIVVDSLVLHALLVVLIGTWCGMEMTQFSRLGGLLFGWRFPIPNSCYQALLMAAPGLYLAYRTNSFWRVALYVPLFTWWTLLQPFAWRFDGNQVFFIAAVGALLLVIAESHVSGSKLAIPYRAYGALLVSGALIPMSYWSFNEYHWNNHVSPFAVIGMSAAILMLAAAIFCLAEWLRYRHLEHGDRHAVSRMDDIRRRQWLPLILVAVVAGLSFWSVRDAGASSTSAGGALIPTVAANLAIVALSLWLISVGLREERGQPFAAGVVYFLLWTLLRYVDLFGELGGMLGAALMFFLCGCALLGVGFYWRNRKRVQYA